MTEIDVTSTPGTPLEEFAKEKGLLDEIAAAHKHVSKVWETWKFHNIEKDFYSSFVFEHNIPILEAAKVKNSLKEDYSKEIEKFSRDEKKAGEEVLSTLRELAGKYGAVKMIFDARLRWLWEQGAEKYPLEEIAKAYGSNPNSMFVIIKRKPWYRARREILIELEQPLDNDSQ